jgi:hypothetical protein
LPYTSKNLVLRKRRRTFFGCFQAQELCGSTPLDIESTIESIEMLDRELEEIKRQAKDGHLRAKPDETVIFFLFLLYTSSSCFCQLG